MSSSTSAAWASVFVAAFATGANLWQAYEAHAEKNIARITKETLDAERREVAALQKEAVAQKQTLSNAIESVNLCGDIIAASGGDRYAYLRAVDKLLLTENIPDKSIYQTERLLNDINRFADHPKSNPTIRSIMYANAITTNNTEVLAYLTSENREARLYAINDIYILRLNALIPNVAKLVETDKDLNVVQYALYVVAETFRNNINDENDNIDESFADFNSVINNTSAFCQMFNTMWEKYRPAILARSPREFIRIHPKENPDLYYEFLHDPERNENIPLPDKDDGFWFETPTNQQLK